MAIYTLQTKDGDLDAVAFPKTFEEVQNKTEVDGIYGFVGTINTAEGFDSHTATKLRYFVGNNAVGSKINWQGRCDIHN